MAHPGGRPPKWNNIEELQKDIDLYFNNTPKEEWTITGLAMAMGTYRTTLMNYQEKDEFLNTIKAAKQKVENSYEVDLKKHGRAGTIFALKNFDWKDKHDVDVVSDGQSIAPNMSDESLERILTVYATKRNAEKLDTATESTTT